MKKLPPSLASCAAIFLLSFGVIPFANATYVFTDLGTLGGSMSNATSINNAGQVAGVSFIAGDTSAFPVVWNNGATVTVLNASGSGEATSINNAGQVAGTSSTIGTYATVWNGATATFLDTPSGGGSISFGMNDFGQVVGRSTLSDISYYPTVWNGTIATILGTLGGSRGDARAINNTGLIAGYSYLAGDVFNHASLWNGTAITDLGTLGGNYSAALDINNSGQVVGNASTSGDSAWHASLWNGTAITDLGTLGGSMSSATAINNAGQVVGWSEPAACNHSTSRACLYATLWDGATIVDLNSFLDTGAISAGWELLQANDINDNGWIVGIAYNNLMDQYHGYLLSDTAFTYYLPPPVNVPEPTTLALLGLGLFGLGLSRRKRL